jgi:hypothetical protein
VDSGLILLFYFLGVPAIALILLFWQRSRGRLAHGTLFGLIWIFLVNGLSAGYIILNTRQCLQHCAGQPGCDLGCSEWTPFFVSVLVVLIFAEGLGLAAAAGVTALVDDHNRRHPKLYIN